MKKNRVLILFATLVFFSILESCGPIVFTTRLNSTPPSWFYPNRIETVRYVYFPEHYIYYDFSLSTYLYLDNNVWIRAQVLPSRYSTINLSRSRYTRINNYFDDNIGQYHSDQRRNTRRNTTITRRRN